MVEVDTSHLKPLGPAMPKVMERGLQLAGQDLVNKLQRNTNRDHGHMASWAIVEHNQSMVKVQSPAFYARYQNYGTGPIVAKRAKALRWEGKGGLVFAKRTKGISGKHFVERSIAQVRPRLDDHFKVAISEVLG